VWLQNLHGTVEHVADEDGSVAARIEPEDRRSRGMTRRSLQNEVTVDAIRIFPQDIEPIPMDRRDAVIEYDMAPRTAQSIELRNRRASFALVVGMKVFVICPRDHIGCVREPR